MSPVWVSEPLNSEPQDSCNKESKQRNVLFVCMQINRNEGSLTRELNPMLLCNELILGEMRDAAPNAMQITKFLQLRFLVSWQQLNISTKKWQCGLISLWDDAVRGSWIFKRWKGNGICDCISCYHCNLKIPNPEGMFPISLRTNPGDITVWCHKAWPWLQQQAFIQQHSTIQETLQCVHFCSAVVFILTHTPLNENAESKSDWSPEQRTALNLFSSVWLNVTGALCNTRWGTDRSWYSMEEEIFSPCTWK